MTARLRSWWQKIRQHLSVTGALPIKSVGRLLYLFSSIDKWIKRVKRAKFWTLWSKPVTGIVVVLLVLFLFIFLAYSFGWDWTGFNSGTSQITITSTSTGNYTATISQPSKSLWDWLSLLGVLAIPVVVGLGGAWYAAQQSKVSARENTDNQREAALKEYFDEMFELLENLRQSSSPDDWVRIVARIRTRNVLHRLDRERKGSVIQFLSDSDLLSIVDLSYDDLSNANLFQVHLTKATLYRADLSKATLFQATLDSANLSNAYMPVADLRGASLMHANLSRANIGYADLRGADLTNATLMEVTLKETKYNKKSVTLQSPLSTESVLLGPTKWPDGFGHEEAEKAGAICVDG